MPRPKTQTQSAILYPSQITNQLAEQLELQGLRVMRSTHEPDRVLEVTFKDRTFRVTIRGTSESFNVRCTSKDDPAICLHSNLRCYSSDPYLEGRDNCFPCNVGRELREKGSLEPFITGVAKQIAIGIDECAILWAKRETGTGRACNDCERQLRCLALPRS